MTRVERRRQRQRQIILRVCAGVGALAFILACVLLLTGGGEAEETELEPIPAYGRKDPGRNRLHKGESHRLP